MHEYSLMQNVVTSILDGLRAEKVTDPSAVKEVHLRIGALDIESFKQAFYMQARDTLLRDAKLELEVAPGDIECSKCGHKQEIGVGDADGHEPQPAIECPKCRELCFVQGGRGIAPIDITVDK
jgi:hydrogenase nickel insertion protein HypA